MGREIHARETRFGRYFEEFELGDVYHHWPGKTITEADDHLFCMITMNHHPLHSTRTTPRPRRSSGATSSWATSSTRSCSA